MLWSCTKKPDLSPIPSISFGKMENNEGIYQAVDTTYVVVNFQDGDGDIGFAGNETKDLFIIDTRESQGDTILRNIPLVPELGAESGITGEIRFPIVTCCVPPSIEIPICNPIPDEYPEYQRDTVVFKVFIRDRAGNFSNVIDLDPIYLKCD